MDDPLALVGDRNAFLTFLLMGLLSSTSFSDEVVFFWAVGASASDSTAVFRQAPSGHPTAPQVIRTKLCPNPLLTGCASVSHQIIIAAAGLDAASFVRRD